jgi:predicted ATPase/DNA-binding winged helix-turn-helix (wHTH) protein
MPFAFNEAQVPNGTGELQADVVYLATRSNPTGFEKERQAALASPFSEFGPFRLYATERRLEKEGRPVLLGSRALDILILLCEKAGSVVTKQQLISHVWPGMMVDECNLRAHIAKLRRALGDGRDDARYIASITGRGYSLVASVVKEEVRTVATEPIEPRAKDLLRPIPNMIGREHDVMAVSKLLKERRFVTLHGPGGVGKSTVAVAVATHMMGLFEDGVCFLDLGTRGSSDAVPEVLASTLGLTEQAADPASRILNYLRDRQMLLVLDCCEHIIDSAAALAEAVVREAPGLTVLGTSREPMRAEGEHVYSLSSLGVPPPDKRLGAKEIWNYPSAQFFLERVIAAGHRPDLSDQDGQYVAEICRKTDGLPHALELAAGRVNTHGFSGTAALLGSSLALLWPGRRTALPRHRTLTAVLDWSYDLLGDLEKAVLQRLSVFDGPFDLSDAQDVAAEDHRVSRREVVEALEHLVAKSLVATDAGEPTRYRLLNTTRAFASAKLAEVTLRSGCLESMRKCGADW